MTERLNNRDWRLISAYLDGRLSPSAKAKVDQRLSENPHFKRSLDEIAYTKRLLATLPQKRAPRNFTLSNEHVKAPRRALWLQPALSFVSVAAAVMLVFVFSYGYIGGGLTRASQAPQAEMLAADSAFTESTAPAIINWNPILGMGGGGGDASAKEIYTGGDGIGGAGGPGFVLTNPGVGGGGPAELPGSLPAPTEMPGGEGLTAPAPDEQMEAPRTDSDLSGLILGLPDSEKAGTIIKTSPLRSEPPAEPQPRIPSRNLLMIIAGVTAILAGAGALILRKISNA